MSSNLLAYLPQHALDEIDEHPEQKGWWLAWAATAEAQDRVLEANARVAASAAEWRACVEKADGKRPADPCDCGECAARHLRLRAARDGARVAHAEAIQAFKDQ